MPGPLLSFAPSLASPYLSLHVERRGGSFVQIPVDMAVRLLAPRVRNVGHTCREVCNFYLILAAALKTVRVVDRKFQQNTSNIGVFFELRLGRIGISRAVPAAEPSGGTYASYESPG